MELSKDPVIRTVTAADGEFAEILIAMRAGAAYANVHTSAFPAERYGDRYAEMLNPDS